MRRLCERQTRSGGLCGRPEKMQDVCYSWWCLSALAILGRLHWIDGAALSRFILFCQARRPPLRHGTAALPACACLLTHALYGHPVYLHCSTWATESAGLQATCASTTCGSLFTHSFSAPACE